MASSAIPHFKNDDGVPRISIGVREFMCCGASDPHDHPHVFLDMGDDTEIVCPYCSTVFDYKSTLPPHASEPADCLIA